MDPKHYCRIFIYVSLLVCLIPPLIRAQTSTKNYVISRTYREANAQVALPNSSVYWGNSRQAVSQISYFDGLGKQKQQVSVYGSNQATKDLFQQTDYDALHRPEKHYLPVAVTPGIAGEYATLSSSFYASGDVLKSPNSSANYFTQTVYESSPLSRTAQVKAPALHTDSSGVQTFYKVSDNTIKRYTAGTGLMDITSSTYAAGELQYTEVVDEYRRTLREYTDYQGRTVLKRIVLGATSFLDTYYVYNAIGQLRAVLQPEFQTSNSTNHAFYYLYDDRGNMTQKKIPGAVSTTMTYDSRDRLKSMTDGKGQVFSYEYEDNLNRLKRTKLANEVISENYYDQYPEHLGLTFRDTLFKEWKDSPAAYLLKGTPTDQVQGMLTASDQYLFNASGTRQGSFLRTLYYYDKKGRLIQTVRQLYGLGNNAIERVSYLLDFTGKVLRERTDQSVNSSTIHLEKGFAYDHMDRLVKVMHRVWTGNKAPKQYTHSELVYDEIGQLKTKKLHGGLQTLTYKNHVRGWMGSIQQSQGKTFSLNLEYLSNGNIKTMAWGADNSSGSMALAYDAASRLTSAMGAGGFNGFNENLAYDKNGNLKRMAIEEGQLVMASDSFRVEYFLRDHLGNVRMVLGENNQVKQVTDYHAFGKAVDRAGNKNSNPYRYNGKEEQDETGFLDYGARQYDPIIGRWMSIDPLASLDFDLTPYHYVSNSPIKRIDIMGCQDCDNNGTDDGTCLQEIVVKGKKTAPDPIFGTLSVTYAYEREMARVTGRSTRAYHVSDRENMIGTAVFAIPAAIYGGAYLVGTGIGTAGINFLANSRAFGLARKLLATKEELTRTVMLGKGLGNLAGQAVENSVAGTKKLDITGLIGDMIGSTVGSALGGAIGSVSYDFEKGEFVKSLNSPTKGIAKFGIGLGFGTLGENIKGLMATPKNVDPSGSNAFSGAVNGMTEGILKAFNSATSMMVDQYETNYQKNHPETKK